MKIKKITTQEEYNEAKRIYDKNDITKVLYLSDIKKYQHDRKALERFVLRLHKGRYKRLFPSEFEQYESGHISTKKLLDKLIALANDPEILSKEDRDALYNEIKAFESSERERERLEIERENERLKKESEEKQREIEREINERLERERLENERLEKEREEEREEERERKEFLKSADRIKIKKITSKEEYEKVSDILNKNLSNHLYRILRWLKEGIWKKSFLKHDIEKNKTVYETFFPFEFRQYKSGNITIDKFCDMLIYRAVSDPTVLTTEEYDRLSELCSDYFKKRADEVFDKAQEQWYRDRDANDRRIVPSSRPDLSHEAFAKPIDYIPPSEVNRTRAMSSMDSIDIKPKSRKLSKSSMDSINIKPKSHKLSKSSMDSFDIKPKSHKLSKSSMDSFDIKPQSRKDLSLSPESSLNIKASTSSSSSSSSKAQNLKHSVGFIQGAEADGRLISSELPGYLDALKYIKTANDYKSIPRVNYKIRAGAKTRKAISESGAIGATINKFRLTVW